MIIILLKFIFWRILYVIFELGQIYLDFLSEKINVNENKRPLEKI